MSRIVKPPAQRILRLQIEVDANLQSTMKIEGLGASVHPLFMAKVLAAQVEHMLNVVEPKKQDAEMTALLEDWRMMAHKLNASLGDARPNLNKKQEETRGTENAPSD